MLRTGCEVSGGDPAHSTWTCCSSGDEVVDEPDLTVPHPRMWERGFVLVPLADLAPELVIGRLTSDVAAWRSPSGPAPVARIGVSSSSSSLRPFRRGAATLAATSGTLEWAERM